MIIEIRKDIFSTANFRQLSMLIQLGIHRDRYKVMVDIAKVKNLENFQRLDRDDQDALTHNFNASIVNQEIHADPAALSETISLFVTSNPRRDNEFNLGEAEAYLNQKVAILLENSLNDEHFIQALIKYISNNPALKQYAKNKFFAFDNAGGCTNITNFLTGKFKEYEHLPKGGNRYYRCFVLVDSDRSSPDEAIDKHHTATVKFLRENNVSYHILEKRAMENYLPIPVFESFRGSTTNDWIDAFVNLNATQQDFFKIPVGFSKKNADQTPRFTRTELRAEVQALYHDVTDENYRKLDTGLQLGNFKANFPKKFTERHEVHRTSLLERTQHQDDSEELEHILDKIAALI